MHELTGFSSAPVVAKGFGDESTSHAEEKAVNVLPAEVGSSTKETKLVEESPEVEKVAQTTTPDPMDQQLVTKSATKNVEPSKKVEPQNVPLSEQTQQKSYNEKFSSGVMNDDWDDDFLKREMQRETIFSDKTQKLREYLDEFDEHPIRSLSKVGKSLFAFAMGVAQRHGMKQMVKNGRLIKAGAMEFVQSGNVLMAYRYCGTADVVEIPSFVGNLPVVVLHPDFFNAGVMHGGLLHSYKARALKSAFVGDYAGDFSQHSVTGAANGILEVKLPNTLQSIFAGTFDGCNELSEIVIPESVVVMPVSAVGKSGIKKIFFNGEIPKDFKRSKFNGVIFVRRK